MKSKIKREFSETAVIARIQSRAGYRLQSSQLAAYFGISTARMTEVLAKLTATKKIRRVRCGGNPTMYYIPTEQELAAEAKLVTVAPPVVIIKVTESVES